MYEIREERDGTVIEVDGDPTPAKLRALCAPFGSLAALDHAALLGAMLDALGVFDHGPVHLGRGLRDMEDMLSDGQDDSARVEWTPGRVSIVTPTSGSRISLVHATAGERRPKLGIFLPAKGVAFDAARAHDTGSGALTLLAELIALGQQADAGYNAIAQGVEGQPDPWARSVSDRASRLVEALRARSVVRRERIECGLILAALPEDADEADAQIVCGTAGFCAHHRRRYSACGCEPMAQEIPKPGPVTDFRLKNPLSAKVQP